MKLAVHQVILVIILMTSASVIFGNNEEWRQANANPREVSFAAADSVVIYGDLYQAKSGKTAPLILLFHQAGSDARGEYGAIIPRLIDSGFNVLALDQRNGGDRLGGTNRTVAALKGKPYSYCEAYPDLEAALKYVIKEGYTGKRFAWGSSYSAALVVRLGVEHAAELAGVLAFSPASGDPMGACNPGPYISSLKLPALVLRPASEMQLERARDQLASFRQHGHRTYVSENGVHGSSMLNPAKVEGSVEPTWQVVLKFIKDVVAQV